MEFPTPFEELANLLAIDSPSGDEYRMAGYLFDLIGRLTLSYQNTVLGQSLIVQRGSSPTTALFAHVDTTGFTLGYDSELIPIGSPAPRPGDRLKVLGSDWDGCTVQTTGRRLVLNGEKQDAPGSRYVFAADPTLDGLSLTAPYLDNRAGLWAATEVLRRCESVVIAFTSGEESSGHGALICAKYLYEMLSIRSAIICDITWNTNHVHIGSGPAISLRDGSVPNRKYIDRITELASTSGVNYQLEIESDGGSDGGHIERSCYPIDWAFVGAPQKHPHSSNEIIDLNDLADMADLLVHLVDSLR